MVQGSERDELIAAWRALSGIPDSEGWRTIPVARHAPCRLLAGRRFPGNEEALLVGFASLRLPLPNQLPQGGGVLVSRADIGIDGANRVWIALCRQSAGNLDLFAMMAYDVVSTLEKLRDADDNKLFQVFLTRIAAWQDFMRRSGDGVLGPEAEVGLFGELELLRDLISGGLHATLAVEAWQGPLDGIHDFVLGTGAIEVKSTLAPSGFPAMIGSLEQLDDSRIRPLFLAGIRLALNVSGKTLADQVCELRDLMREESAAQGIFDSRLLHAGFLDAGADRYTRRFSRIGKKIMKVSGDFPRLTPANVAIEIRRARYEIDLDLVSAEDVELAHALEQTGMIQQWN